MIVKIKDKFVCNKKNEFLLNIAALSFEELSTIPLGTNSRIFTTSCFNTSENVTAVLKAYMEFYNLQRVFE